MINTMGINFILEEWMNKPLACKWQLNLPMQPVKISLILICKFGNQFVHILKLFAKMMNGLIQIERLASLFKIIRMVRVNVKHFNVMLSGDGTFCNIYLSFHFHPFIDHCIIVYHCLLHCRISLTCH